MTRRNESKSVVISRKTKINQSILNHGIDFSEKIQLVRMKVKEIMYIKTSNMSSSTSNMMNSNTERQNGNITSCTNIENNR